MTDPQSAASSTKRIPWRIRWRAAWRGLSIAERIAWIIAVGLVVSGLEIGGLFAIAGGSDKPFAFVLNRFTGTVSFCIPTGCKEL
jgi:hypothetical protein